MIVCDHEFRRTLHSLYYRFGRIPRVIDKLIKTYFLHNIVNRISLSKSKEIKVVTRRSVVSKLIPHLAVVVLPDDEGVGFGRDSAISVPVEPHPVVVKGVAVEDHVVVNRRARRKFDHDDVPCRVPGSVKMVG